MSLGKGSYGAVSLRDGKAVKTFAKLSHLIQEYTALQYLHNCKYIVHSRGVDFEALELHMELYDRSLRKWIEEGPELKRRPNINEIMNIVHDVLMGLVELHDRSLAHGDLKPGNILIRNNPLKAVLGDCGFVSIAKYAKVDRTAPIYRDPVVNHDSSHDMFSFGICFLELLGDTRIVRQASYDELKSVVNEKVHNQEYKKILFNLLNEDKDRRLTARNLLFKLFGEDPPRWSKPVVNCSDHSNHSNNFNHSNHSNERLGNTMSEHERNYVRKLVKDTGHEFEINRSRKGYGALLAYIDNNKISSNDYRINTGVVLMILSSLFGKSGFREQEVYELCERKYSYNQIYMVLNRILSDSTFLNILLGP